MIRIFFILIIVPTFTYTQQKLFDESYTVWCSQNTINAVSEVSNLVASIEEEKLSEEEQLYISYMKYKFLIDLYNAQNHKEPRSLNAENIKYLKDIYAKMKNYANKKGIENIGSDLLTAFADLSNLLLPYQNLTDVIKMSTEAKKSYELAIKKEKPFSILILVLTVPFYGQNLQNIYEENFREGSALPVDQVLELKNSIVETNINDLGFWGNIAINTILSYPRNINDPEFITLKKELINVFNTLYKIKYRDIPINQLFNLGMFGYNMMAVYKELAISMFKPYYFSKDIFLYILSKYKNTSYYLSSQMMLAIYLTFPANPSTINFNQVINKTLSETAINNLQDPIIKYIAYVYKSMFFMKIDQYQNAQITLKKAEKIFPKATLHQLIYGLWAIEKDGF